MHIGEHTESSTGIIDNSTQVFRNTRPSFTHQGTFGTPEVVDFIISSFRGTSTLCNILYMMGCAGSGKTYLSHKLVKRFQALLPKKFNPFCLATDDYCVGTRLDRRRIIQKTHDALLEKDFTRMEQDIDQIKKLKEGEQLVLSQPYDPNTGLALAGPSKRTIEGPVGVLVIDGNFHAKASEDLLVFLHVPDPVRYQMRAVRDVKEGQKRAESKEEVLERFLERQETQDVSHTLPWMKKADILLESRPDIRHGEIHGIEYDVFIKFK